MAARDDGGAGLERHACSTATRCGTCSGAFYQAPPESGRMQKAAPLREEKAAKPTHYKVICISMYTKDLDRLDELVEELKGRGITKANRSALIRVALEQLDLDKVPRGL